MTKVKKSASRTVAEGKVQRESPTPPPPDPRPSPGPRFTEAERRAAQDHVVKRLSLDGWSVTAACREIGITATLPNEWALTDPTWSLRYARAREEQAHRYGEQTLQAAHGVDDFALAVRKCLESEDAVLREQGNPYRIQLINSLRHGAIQRDTLRVNTLKWYTGKICPRLYGEKLDVTSGGEKVKSGVVVLPAKDMPTPDGGS